MASPTRPPPPPPRAPDDEPAAPDVEQEDDADPPQVPRGPALPSTVDTARVGGRRVLRRAEAPRPAADPDHLDVIDED